MGNIVNIEISRSHYDMVVRAHVLEGGRKKNNVPRLLDVSLPDLAQLCVTKRVNLTLEAITAIMASIKTSIVIIFIL